MSLISDETRAEWRNLRDRYRAAISRRDWAEAEELSGHCAEAMPELLDENEQLRAENAEAHRRAGQLFELWTEATQTVRIEPNGVLLIGGVGRFERDDMAEAVQQLKAWAGAVGVCLFSSDIDVQAAESEAASENERLRGLLTEIHRLATGPLPHAVVYEISQLAAEGRGVVADSPTPDEPSKVTTSDDEPGSLWGKGCPVDVWDGPYKMRCSLGGSRGTCSVHGKFADPPSTSDTRTET